MAKQAKPRRYQRAAALADKGKDYKEIAKILKCTEGTASSLLTYGRRIAQGLPGQATRNGHPLKARSVEMNAEMRPGGTSRIQIALIRQLKSAIANDVSERGDISDLAFAATALVKSLEA